MEILNLSEAEFKSLDSYQRKILKQIQHLPEKMVNGAVYLLHGTLSIRARIEINQLTLFLMALSGSSIESKIAERQLAMKDLNSKRWFMGYAECSINTICLVHMICHTTLHQKGLEKSNQHCSARVLE